MTSAEHSCVMRQTLSNGLGFALPIERPAPKLSGARDYKGFCACGRSFLYLMRLWSKGGERCLGNMPQNPQHEAELASPAAWFTRLAVPSTGPAGIVVVQ